MNLHALGHTRSRRALNHLLQTPDTFVYAALPGMQACTAAVHAAPAIGADFTQYTAVFEQGGVLGDAAGSRFLYVLHGAVNVSGSGFETTALHAEGFAFLRQHAAHQVRATEPSRVVVIEKRYEVQPGTAEPHIVFGSAHNAAGVPLMGDAALQVKALLPENAAFDLAVNIMEYQPGARLSMVESHTMEHGLLMLDGEGIYRLGDAWYPVAAGDFIWMAPFCPQWFGALGSKPARYLIYKNVNRHPLGERRATW